MPTSIFESALECHNAAISAASTSSFSPVFATVSSFNPIDNEIREYTDKTDRHVDQLEEDIEFLTKKYKELLIMLDEYKRKCDELECKLECKLSDEASRVNNLYANLLNKIDETRW